MKKIILLLLLVVVNTSCKNSYSNEFIINSPSVIVSKEITNDHKLKYKYGVKHYSSGRYYRAINIHTNQNFIVGDTLKLTTK